MLVIVVVIVRHNVSVGITLGSPAIQLATYHGLDNSQVLRITDITCIVLFLGVLIGKRLTHLLHELVYTCALLFIQFLLHCQVVGF